MNNHSNPDYAISARAREGSTGKKAIRQRGLGRLRCTTDLMCDHKQNISGQQWRPVIDYRDLRLTWLCSVHYGFDIR